jgi:hypothetical protein
MATGFQIMSSQSMFSLGVFVRAFLVTQLAPSNQL